MTGGLEGTIQLDISDTRWYVSHVIPDLPACSMQQCLLTGPGHSLPCRAAGMSSRHKEDARSILDSGAVKGIEVLFKDRRHVLLAEPCLCAALIPDPPEDVSNELNTIPAGPKCHMAFKIKNHNLTHLETLQAKHTGKFTTVPWGSHASCFCCHSPRSSSCMTLLHVTTVATMTKMLQRKSHVTSALASSTPLLTSDQEPSSIEGKRLGFAAEN